MAQSRIIKPYTYDFIDALAEIQEKDKSITDEFICELLDISAQVLSNIRKPRNNIRKPVLQIFVNYFNIKTIKGFTPKKPAETKKNISPDNKVKEETVVYPAVKSEQLPGNNIVENGQPNVIDIKNFPPEVVNMLKEQSDQLELVVTNMNSMSTSITTMTDTLREILDELRANKQGNQ